MGKEYAWEKFHLAVLGLVTSQKPLHDRLADAYVYHLMHAERDLPEEIREDFKQLRDALSRKEAVGDEGSVAASAAALNESEAHKLLELIVSMYDEVVKYGPNG
jgi:hypothetical protein